MGRICPHGAVGGTIIIILTLNYADFENSSLDFEVSTSEYLELRCVFWPKNSVLRGLPVLMKIVMKKMYVGGT